MNTQVVPPAPSVARGTGTAVLALAAEPCWWPWLVTGVNWTIAALVILQPARSPATARARSAWSTSS